MDGRAQTNEWVRKVYKKLAVQQTLFTMLLAADTLRVIPYMKNSVNWTFTSLPPLTYTPLSLTARIVMLLCILLFAWHGNKPNQNIAKKSTASVQDSAKSRSDRSVVPYKSSR
eukprot:66428_1